MYEAAEQMGEGMPVNLNRNFEYRRARGKVESEEVKDDDQSGEGSELGDQGEIIIAVAGSGYERSEGMARADQSAGGDRLEVRGVGTRVASGLGEVTEAIAGTEVVDGGWSADEHSSTMTKQKLDQLREEYAIPSNIRLRAPTGDEKPSAPPLGWATLCADMLKQGVRLE